MPLVQVAAAQGTLNRKDQDMLVSRLSRAVLKVEGANADDPVALALVWAHYIELPEGGCYVGGQNLNQPPLIIFIMTPQGALNEQTRNTLAAEVGAIVDDILGTFENRLNHWAMMSEISEGSWAGAGQIFPLAGIQAAMNIKAA